MADKVEMAVIEARDNAADTAREAGIMMGTQEASNFVFTHVMESADIYADTYGVPVAEFIAYHRGIEV
jgi:hypothetical protein